MKKRFAALIIAAMAAMPAFAFTAMAEEKAPVVDEVKEIAPDPFIGGMSVVWYDEAGSEYRQAVCPQKEEKAQEQDADRQFTWSDGAGNTFMVSGAKPADMEEN